MSDHSRYEELAALAAGGHLNNDELTDLQRHADTCAQCNSAFADFREIVQLGLPLVESPFRRSINMITSRPDPGARERFIRRASLEGIAFSPEVKRPAPSQWQRFNLVAASVCGLAVIVTAVLYFSHHLGPSFRQFDRDPMQARQQLDRLAQQNSTLEATISRLEQTNAEHQRETEALRSQMAALTSAASRHDNDQGRADTAQSVSHSTQLLEEAEAERKTQEKLLADTRTELAALKKARASDQASIVADQFRINELSDQLKTANANVKLATTGGDVRNLMGARQLHVIDVRDTDPNGKPGKAFGRIFLTEGKSLVFYAFDLNSDTKNDGKKTYQVWAQQDGKAGPVHSLGLLKADNMMQGRWALKSTDPAALKQINSIFVTVEPQGGAKTPSGQHLLFAYLGQPNHP
jgi:Anti-sigma-K factor rskA